MNQIITTKTNTASQNTTAHRESRKSPNTRTSVPLFHRINYILMAVGVVVLAIGYIALSGGAAEDPGHFNEAIFDTRRLVVAPILMLLGLVTELFAIMWHPMTGKKSEKSAE